jgi:hypothetical protein
MNERIPSILGSMRKTEPKREIETGRSLSMPSASPGFLITAVGKLTSNKNHYEYSRFSMRQFLYTRFHRCTAMTCSLSLYGMGLPF